MLEAFASAPIDTTRARRLALGAVFGAATILGAGVLLSKARAAAPPAREEVEEPIAVALVETPEELPPEPTPEPTRPSEPRPGPRRPAPAAMPTAVPDKVKLADVADTYDTGSGAVDAGSGTGTGSGFAAAAPPPPPPPPPPPAAPPPKKPALSPDDYDPPQCKLGAPNRAAAKSLGVEGTVVIKYTVSESGSITQARVVKGPPELHSLALAALNGSQCRPARMKSDGSAISVTRTVRYPIRFSAN